MLYCFVGENIENPSALPVNHANVSNFNLLSEEVVRAFGYIPFVENTPPEHNALTHKVNKSLAMIDNNVTYNYELVPLEPEEVMLKMNDLKLFFVSIIEKLLDETVQQKDYKNILHACSYSESSIPQYKAETLAVIYWRDSVWGKTYQIQNEILVGQRAIPTLEQFLAEMPVMEWPT